MTKKRNKNTEKYVFKNIDKFLNFINYDDSLLIRNFFTPDIDFMEFLWLSDGGFSKIIKKIYYFNEEKNDIRYYKSEIIFTFDAYGVEYFVYILIDNDEGSCLTCNMHSNFFQKMYISDTFDNLIKYHIGEKKTSHIIKTSIIK